MLKQFSIESVGSGGLNADVIPYSLKENILSNVRNIRTDNTALKSTNGWYRFVTQNIGTSATYFIYEFGDAFIDQYIIGLSNAVVYFDGSTFTSILSFTGPYDTAKYSACRLGDAIIYTNSELQKIYYINRKIPLTTALLPFKSGKVWDQSGSGMAKYPRIVRAHNNFLFALGMTENSIYMPDAFRWSHPADPNSLPATWDEADTAFIAGFAQLGTASGAIIDGKSLRDTFVIYSERAINNLDLTGDMMVWRKRELTSTFGLLNSRCIVEVNGLHYILGTDDGLVNDGNRISSIMDTRIRKHFAANSLPSAANIACVVNNDIRKEIWFCVQTATDSGGLDTAYVYNWAMDTWTIRDLNPGIGHVTYGSRRASSGGATWSSLAGVTWYSRTTPWSNSLITPYIRSVMGIKWSAASKMEAFDLDPDTAQSTVTSFIERIAIPLGEHTGVKLVSSIRIRLTCAGTVKVTIGSQYNESDNVKWESPVTYDPNLAKNKIDFRCSGRFFSYRIESINNIPFTFSGIDFDFADAGLR